MPGLDLPLSWLLVLGGLLLTGVLGWTWRRSARPADWGDLLRTDRPSRGYLGLIRRGALRPEESRRVQHVLVIGPPEQTAARYVQPNLLLDANEGVSVVVFERGGADSDGAGHSPLGALAPAFIPQHDVQVFAPFEPLSLRYPLLGVLEAAAAAGLAEALLHGAGTPPGTLSGTEAAQHHQSAQLALLEGLLLDASARLGGSLQAVLELVQSGPDALGAHLAGAERVARQRTHLYFSLRQEQQEAVAAALARTLAVFADDHLDRATRSASDVQRPGDTVDVALALTRAAAISIRLPAEVSRSFSGQALHRLLQHRVLEQLLEAGSGLGGAPPQHVSVYLVGSHAGTDPLPGWPAQLSALRLTRVACHLLCPPEAEVPDPERAGSEGADPEGSSSGVSGPGLFGQVLRLAADPVQGAELKLADGRSTQVWLPTLSERRLGPVLNPLFEAARQRELPEAQSETLTGDLVLRRLLTRRAELVTWPSDVPGDPGAHDPDTDGTGTQTVDATDASSNETQYRAPLPSATEREVEQNPAPARPASGELITWQGKRLSTEPPWEQHSGPELPSPEPTPRFTGQTSSEMDDAYRFEEGLPEEDEGEDFDRSVFENPVEVRQVRLLKLLSEHRDLTPAQVVALTDLPETTVRRDLNILEDSGLVTSARVAGKRRYRLLPPESQQP